MSQARGWIIWATVIAVGAVVTSMLLAGVYEAIYWGRVYPGVNVAGVRLDRLTLDEAEDQIRQLAQRPTDLRLSWNKNEWAIDLASVEGRYEVKQTAAAVMAVGRRGGMWQNLGKKMKAGKEGVAVDLMYTLDNERLRQQIGLISSQIDIPVKEAGLNVEKLPSGEVRVFVSPGQNGQVVDDKELLSQIDTAWLLKTPADIQVPVKILTPRLREDQVRGLETRVARIYDKKIELAGEGQKWELTGEQLVAWLDPIEQWKQLEIQAWVKEFAQGFDRPAQNAFFRYENGRVREFKPGNTGVTVVQEMLAGLVGEALKRLELGEQTIALTVPTQVTEPAVKTADVNDLGIKELIGKGESRFTGSIANRKFNIGVAARNMDGVLVAPGEVFSFNKHVGDISAAGGYKPGYIIKDGKTILGDGGGVCQVSSTMFRAALNAGLPIEERWAHAYRVSYYELDIGPGYDATIFTPTVDLKWKNDTPGYVLIQAKLDEVDAKLAFELYGTSDGRKVSFSKTRVWDRTPPPPTLYIDDPNLAKGVTKLTEHAIYGSKVAFDWTVTRGQEVLQKRTWYSNFQPWQGVYLVGTKI